MSNLWSLTKRELSAYFLSPTAYVVLALFLLVSGYIFSTTIIPSRQPDLRPVLGNMTVIFLFMAPALTARLWAEEVKQGTDEFLLTAPISTTQIVLAKYFAALLLFLSYLGVTLIYPGILEWLGSPDWSALLTGYLGVLLVGSVAIAAGFFASSLTDSQMIAALIAFALVMTLWLLSWASDALPAAWAPYVRYLSLTNHAADFIKGIIDTRHLVYFFTVTGGFLFLTAQRLESARWR